MLSAPSAELIERVAAAIWESQRGRIKDQNSINARLSWGCDGAPDVFWDSYRADAAAAIVAVWQETK